MQLEAISRKGLAGRRSMALAVGLLISTLTFGYPAPPADPDVPTSKVPPAVQQLRRDMLDPGVNTLTFRSMDRIFTTRTVGHSGNVWQLPRADQTLNFTYQFKGQTYTPEQFLERTYTNALLVMKDGKIVSEIYRNNTNEQTRFMAFSMTKSITSILIGCALAEKRIESLDDPIVKYLPELVASAYNGVTIRQILQMRSGVDYEERYDFAHPGIAARNHELALVENVVRFADVARIIKRKYAPGESFQYKTLDTAVLGWLLERVSGGSTVAAYTAQRLWEPLGTEADGFYIMDGQPGEGREFSGAGFNATLRDFARVGLMMLNGGVANGHRIVSEEWVRDSTKSLPTGLPGFISGYGYQWWMGVSPGSYHALGLQGQFIYVDPASRTVVVKLSYDPPGVMEPDEETGVFLEAVSKWKGR